MERKRERRDYPSDKQGQSRNHLLSTTDDSHEELEELYEKRECARGTPSLQRPTKPSHRAFTLRESVENDLHSRYPASTLGSVQRLFLEPNRSQGGCRQTSKHHSTSKERKHQFFVDAISKDLKKQLLSPEGSPTRLCYKMKHSPRTNEIANASSSRKAENCIRSSRKNLISEQEKKEWKSAKENTYTNHQANDYEADYWEQPTEPRIKLRLGKKKCRTSVLGKLAEIIPKHVDNYVHKAITRELENYVLAKSELLNYDVQRSESSRICQKQSCNCQLPANEALSSRLCRKPELSTPIFDYRSNRPCDGTSSFSHNPQKRFCMPPHGLTNKEQFRFRMKTRATQTYDSDECDCSTPLNFTQTAPESVINCPPIVCTELFVEDGRDKLSIQNQQKDVYSSCNSVQGDCTLFPILSRTDLSTSVESNVSEPDYPVNFELIRKHSLSRHISNASQPYGQVFPELTRNLSSQPHISKQEQLSQNATSNCHLTQELKVDSNMTVCELSNMGTTEKVITFPEASVSEASTRRGPNAASNNCTPIYQLNGTGDATASVNEHKLKLTERTEEVVGTQDEKTQDPKMEIVADKLKGEVKEDHLTTEEIRGINMKQCRPNMYQIRPTHWKTRLNEGHPRSKTHRPTIEASHPASTKTRGEDIRTQSTSSRNKATADYIKNIKHGRESPRYLMMANIRKRIPCNVWATRERRRLLKLNSKKDSGSCKLDNYADCRIISNQVDSKKPNVADSENWQEESECIPKVLITENDGSSQKSTVSEKPSFNLQEYTTLNASYDQLMEKLRVDSESSNINRFSLIGYAKRLLKSWMTGPSTKVSRSCSNTEMIPTKFPEAR